MSCDVPRSAVRRASSTSTPMSADTRFRTEFAQTSSLRGICCDDHVSACVAHAVAHRLGRATFLSRVCPVGVGGAARADFPAHAEAAGCVGGAGAGCTPLPARVEGQVAGKRTAPAMAASCGRHVHQAVQLSDGMRRERMGRGRGGEGGGWTSCGPGDNQERHSGRGAEGVHSAQITHCQRPPVPCGRKMRCHVAAAWSHLEPTRQPSTAHWSP